jgi:ribosomal-protein-alanine N-acetyltransferase
LLLADLNDRARLGQLLDAHIPVGWPRNIYDEGVLAYFLDRLSRDPDSVGWWSWYGILRDDDGDRSLVTGAGFKGPPVDSRLEIGYGVIAEYRRRGIAREAVEALLDWAFEDPQILLVQAHAASGNVPSERVLDALGFQLDPTERPRTEGLQRYSLSRMQHHNLRCLRKNAKPRTPADG